MADSQLPLVTLVIEWENAIDVADEWTHRAMSALQREMEVVAPRMPAKPRIMYLYDETSVDADLIDKTLDQIAPELRKVADVEIVPTPGFTYYKLKNFGIARSTTDITIMLDSDAAPQPGWVENLVKPFADPEVMVVGGFTIMAHTDLVSKTMALIWLFDLPEEKEETASKILAHANNCAVRTQFFREHPFPDYPMFKKHFGMWLRDLVARGHGFVRTADAMTIHAPHPGFGYVLWRGWQSGSDRDFQIYLERSAGRLKRIGAPFSYLVRKTRRNWKRIAKKGELVGLPAWKRPASMAVALTYQLASTAGELTSALRRNFFPVPSAYKRIQESD